jgi:hypothetical protein
MSTVPEKPAGSVIEESVDPTGVTLSWPHPSPGFARFLVAALLVLWLCGWATGWVAAAGQVAGGNGGLFLVAWLGAWTVGGVVAVGMLCAMFRPTRPESVRLEADVLRYDPGRPAFNPVRQRGRRGYPAAPRRSPAATVPRADIRKFVLDRVGGRQRLSLDGGADRVEVGAGLREPEREWLYAVLRRWHTPAG